MTRPPVCLTTVVVLLACAAGAAASSGSWMSFRGANNQMTCTSTGVAPCASNSAVSSRSNFGWVGETADFVSWGIVGNHTHLQGAFLRRDDTLPTVIGQALPAVFVTATIAPDGNSLFVMAHSHHHILLQYTLAGHFNYTDLVSWDENYCCGVNLLPLDPAGTKLLSSGPPVGNTYVFSNSGPDSSGVGRLQGCGNFKSFAEGSTTLGLMDTGIVSVDIESLTCTKVWDLYVMMAAAVKAGLRPCANTSNFGNNFVAVLKNGDAIIACSNSTETVVARLDGSSAGAPAATVQWSAVAWQAGVQSDSGQLKFSQYLGDGRVLVLTKVTQTFQTLYMGTLVGSDGTVEAVAPLPLSGISALASTHVAADGAGNLYFTWPDDSLYDHRPIFSVDRQLRVRWTADPVPSISSGTAYYTMNIAVDSVGHAILPVFNFVGPFVTYTFGCSTVASGHGGGGDSNATETARG